MQELGQFDFKINVIPNRLEKYMNFNINNKLIFSGSFQFFSSSLDSLFKSLSKDHFKKLSPEFVSKVSNVAKQKGFYPYEYMSDFGKFKEHFPSKENLFSSLTGKKNSDKAYEHVFKVWIQFETKM